MKRRHFLTGAAAAVVVPITAAGDITTRPGATKVLDLSHEVTCMTVHNGKLYVAGGNKITVIDKFD